MAALSRPGVRAKAGTGGEAASSAFTPVTDVPVQQMGNYATALRATGRFSESLHELRRAATADGDEDAPVRGPS